MTDVKLKRNLTNYVRSISVWKISIFVFTLVLIYVYLPIIIRSIILSNDEDDEEEELETFINITSVHNDSDYLQSVTNRSGSDFLFKNVKVLCWILTEPRSHKIKAVHVKATWGKRCNKLIFVSSKEDKSLPTVALAVAEGRTNLWGKTKHALEYVYKNYYDQAEWFLKADDDSYVIMENLRLMLYTKNTSEPLYFGCRLKTWVKQGFMNGGAGYVLSKEALRRFVVEAVPNPKLCKQSDKGNEDVEVARCLQAVKVPAMDSRDYEKRLRFIPINMNMILNPMFKRRQHWLKKYTYYHFPEGLNCCSDSAISFHHVKNYEMYVLEYFIYHLRAFGIQYNLQIPEKTR